MDNAWTRLHESHEMLRGELVNIAGGSSGINHRFNRQKFRDDTEFADWAQSRCRHTLSQCPPAAQELPAAARLPQIAEAKPSEQDGSATKLSEKRTSAQQPAQSGGRHYTLVGEIVEVPDDLGTRICEWNEARWSLPAGTKIYAEGQ